MTPPHRLDSLFRPRAVAIVGASERNLYARLALENLTKLGYGGKIFLINPRGGDVGGRATFPSCGAVGEPIDTAYISVPITAALDAITDAVAAGAKNCVVLTSGFAEVGAEGAALQEKIVSLCAAKDVGLLGPNCLGFVNYVDNVAMGSIPARLPQPPTGSIAIVSASGATAAQLLEFAHQQAISVGHVVATGNEAGVTTADVLDFLVDDDSTKAIAVFLETVNKPEKFAEVAERARLKKKPIVVLKIGASEVTAAVAAAHTGALVGNDRVFDAACRTYGIVRVSGFQKLITTAAALGNIGPIATQGVGIVSISGGACEVMADLAAAEGVPVPRFSPDTAKALRDMLSDLGQTHNPLDLTGAAVRDPTLWTKSLKTISEDPTIGLVVCQTDIPDQENPGVGHLEYIARGMHAAATPTAILTNSVRPIRAYGQDQMQQHKVPAVISGIEDGMLALGKLMWWSKQVLRPPRAIAGAAKQSTARPRTERESLAHLEKFGVPVIPATLARTADDAVRAAQTHKDPVVLKIHSADIAHKTNVGGVELNVRGDDAVRAAFEKIMTSVKRAAPAAKVDGIIVSPMRSGGRELFVGITQDPVWGPVMAVGLGGIWVEAMDDSSLLLLPATKDDVKEALLSLRGAKLLGEFRGTAAINLEHAADAIVRIGEAARVLGPQLAAFEVNPLLATKDSAEALDALAVWN